MSISPDNLQAAYEQARKHKTNNPKVIEFVKHWQLHLATLHRELKTKTYKPQPLKTFILRDPKTRKICVSDFRDRVVHHALVNILQPIFEPRFICDSYASRIRKGTLPSLKRFTAFMRRVSKNGRLFAGAMNANGVQGYALKADIYHYFETVDHNTLLRIIGRRIRDEDVLRLVKTILENYQSGVPRTGMPLGNWTSQFFANVYLNELDQFVKHKLKAKYYLRYVDDFIVLHRSKQVLQDYEKQINAILRTLQLTLHPGKCKVIPLGRGISFIGFRTFYYYKIVRQRNLRKMQEKLQELLDTYQTGESNAQEVLQTLQGWNACAMQGNTHHLRQRLTTFVEQELKRRTPMQR